jgi:hypothetical protein
MNSGDKVSVINPIKIELGKGYQFGQLKVLCLLQVLKQII